MLEPFQKLTIQGTPMLLNTMGGKVVAELVACVRYGLLGR